MFRSRFNEAFSTKVPHVGPQDIERGIVDGVPSPQVESLLCALLGLVMNRKKPVERGHYGRALEEALASHKSEWPRAWHGANPLSGSRTFSSLSPEEKLTLLRALVIWALHSSEAVTTIIKDKYKQARQEGDHNQPLSIQPWGTDGSRRAYWLIEGQDDTHFRVYRERKSKDKSRVQWRSVAESIDDLRSLSQQLHDDGAQAARRLGTMIGNAIPRFEATEEKRKRREYRVMRKAQFSRPEPGFSLYEGRTRGKRARYTFSEDEDSYSDAASTRRSARQSGFATPSEPVVTASGRQVRPRAGGNYGEIHANDATAPNGYADDLPGSEEPDGRMAGVQEVTKVSRPGWKGWALVADDGPRPQLDSYNEVDAMDDDEDEDEAMSSNASEGEWDGGDEDDDVIRARDADDEIDEDSDVDTGGSGVDDEPQSLIVTLRYNRQTNTSTEHRSTTNEPRSSGRSADTAPYSSSSTIKQEAKTEPTSSNADPSLKQEPGDMARDLPQAISHEALAQADSASTSNAMPARKDVGVDEHKTPLEKEPGPVKPAATAAFSMINAGTTNGLTAATGFAEAALAQTPRPFVNGTGAAYWQQQSTLDKHLTTNARESLHTPGSSTAGTSIAKVNGA